MKPPVFTAAASLVLLTAGCLKTQNEVEIKPIEIKPMQITIDLNVKVDKELDSALGTAPSATTLDTSTEKGRLIASFRERREALKKLKTQGVLGENNKGLLELRIPANEATAEAALLLTAENAARTRMYEIIAREQNTTADFVATRCATRIAERAPAGLWYQNAQGEWLKK